VDDTTAKLTDFGIAHICGATITHTGTHLGTIPYMSPEQILGKNISTQSDMYSIGVMLYELLTGDLPFAGKDTSYHHIHTAPRPPHDLVPTLSPELNTIILKCLVKRPEDRYQNGKLLREALLAYLGALQ
jgi:serine/threonine-protein kinase